ncbi:hypothetical protein AB3331_05330 [Streptococcus sp. H49]
MCLVLYNRKNGKVYDVSLEGEQDTFAEELPYVKETWTGPS